MEGLEDKDTVRSTGQKRAAFTLAEVSIAMAVIGFGVLSLLHAMVAGSKVNAHGRDLTQATFLAQEVREWTLRLPFSDPDNGDADNPPGPDGTSPQTFVDDLDDLMGVTFSPPRDGLGDPIGGMNGWSQTIEMDWKNPDDLSATVSAGSSDVICVTVAVKHENTEVLRTSWLVFRRNIE